MVNKALLPLALIYANENQRPIDGATRFQKLVFLAQKEKNIGDIVGDEYDYISDKYGPFSPQLATALEQLEAEGFIKKDETMTRAGNEKHTFRLTNKGRIAIRNLREDEEEVMDALLQRSRDLMETYGDKPFERLLRYVYTNYEDYTSESELEL